MQPPTLTFNEKMARMATNLATKTQEVYVSKKDQATTTMDKRLPLTEIGVGTVLCIGIVLLMFYPGAKWNHVHQGLTQAQQSEEWHEEAARLVKK